MSNIKDFKIKKGVLAQYNGSDAEITIPDNVSIIGTQAFKHNSNIQQVIIPEGVTRIEVGAFWGCSELSSITIPKSITHIESGAFLDCGKLKAVHITDIESWCSIECESNSNILENAEGLFLNGTVIRDLVIPDGVKKISTIFSNYSGLTSITIPSSVTKVGNKAFENCKNLNKVFISDIDSWAGIDFASFDANPLQIANDLRLNGNEVTEIRLSDNVIKIGSYAFAGYSKLTGITIPDSVKEIGDGAFYGCRNLTHIRIPDSVASMGRRAFDGCKSLTEIKIPSAVTQIEEMAFYECSGLESITIPNNVGSIGFWAFKGCTGLRSVVLPSGLTSIEGCAFMECAGLSSISIPAGVTAIKGRAFEGCTALTSVMIPESVEELASNAFKKNTKLTFEKYIWGVEKWIPSEQLVITKTPIQEIKSTNAKTLAVQGFLATDDISIYDENVIESYQKYLKGKVINYVDFILKKDVEKIVKRLASLGLLDSKFVDKMMEKKLSDEIKAVMLESEKESDKSKKMSATKTSGGAELKCNKSNRGEENKGSKEQIRTKGLRITNNIVTKYVGEDKDVVVPEGVRKIGVKAFNMTGVRSIILPSTLESIDKEAFANNSLESLRIPANVKEIDVSAFSNAFGWNVDGLSVDPANKSFTYRDHILFSADETIIYWADRKHKFGDLVIPASVIQINDQAFEYCSIQTITCNSIINIGWHAFVRCYGLKSARFPKGSRRHTWYDTVSSDAEDFYLIAPDAYISSSLDDQEKEAKLRGYAVAYTEGIIYTEEVEKNSDQYIRNHFNLTKKYYYTMPEYRRLVLGKKLLTRDQAEELVSQCEQQGLTEERAELLEYINERFPKETIEKKVERTLNKDPYAPKIMKEIWSYKKLPDGNIELTGYKGNEAVVKVPPRIGDNTVTSIGSETFRRKFWGQQPDWRKTCGESVETIILPETIRKVGQWAFMDCRKLSRVELNEGLEQLNGSAFSSCDSLKELYIPESCFMEFLACDGQNTGELRIPEYGSDIDAIFARTKRTLLCKPGSLAEQYALKQGYPIKHI